MATLIWTLLNHHLYSDATHLAEIYHAEVNNEESLYLVALSYFRARKINAAYQVILRKIDQIPSCNQAKCRLLLTQCCYELGKFHEAERAIFSDDFNLTQNINLKEQFVKYFGETSAAIAAKYAGLIYERTCRLEAAIDFFRISVELNPYLWGSAEALIRITNLFNSNESSTPNVNFNSLDSISSFLANALSKTRIDTSQQVSINSESLPLLQPQLQQATTQQNQLMPLLKQTQSQPLQQQLRVTTATPNNMFITPPKRPPVVVKSTAELIKAPKVTCDLTKKTKITQNQPPACPRRSSRLFSNIGNNQAPTNRNSISISNVSNAPAKKMRRTIATIPEQELALDSMGEIYWRMYKALDALSQYKLDQSISILNDLPARHRNTGWVLSCLGRAYYEKTDYNQSLKCYQTARRLEPYRVEGMEYYSSALWHLHKEIELSILAKELMEFDENCPETWCVAGNCYSLQKEHELAIKYLEKAIKVDPNCAYAYTLLGHELISTDRLDQAMTCFRNAKRLDPRHWNAWCGLGSVYFKNEKYADAELYYRKALKIAPTNPVLLCQLAVVQHVCRKSDAAIETLTEALKIDPNNPLCRFHRATIYSSLDRNKEALEELDELRQIAPEESMVYFLIGKIHQEMGNSDTALITFSWSTQLDPKGANNPIRKVIDTVGSSNGQIFEDVPNS